jgi:hypothetical protein
VIARILTEGQYNIPGSYINELNEFDNHLVESDLMLPEPDLTLQEAEELFVGEGLLPG